VPTETGGEESQSLAHETLQEKLNRYVLTLNIFDLLNHKHLLEYEKFTGMLTAWQTATM
jgi:hypothetical protein